MNDTLKLTGGYSDEFLFTREGEFVAYYPNGKRQSRFFFDKSKPVGTTTFWYSNGQLKEVRRYVREAVVIDNFYDSLGNVLVEKGEGTYITEDKNVFMIERAGDFVKNRVTLKGPVKHGVMDGMFTGYLSDGSVFCHEEYADNDFVKGVSTVNGKEIRYKTLEDQDFLERLMKYISKNLRYPSNARRFGIEGQVFMWLVINPDYTINKAVLAKGVSPEVDAEALRIFQNADLKFGPILRRGLPVDAEKVCMPIRFKLAN